MKRVTAGAIQERSPASSGRAEVIHGRRLTRRAASVGLAVVVAAGVPLLSLAQGASASPSRSEHLITTTPRPKGRLTSITWDLPQGEPTTLDYVKSGTYSPNLVVENMCDDLLRLTPTYGIKPALATSWHYTNPTTLVFQIRKGVYFWNSQELTATDVTYSLLRNEDKALGPVDGIYYTDVKSITTTGTYQVTVKFKTPDELFLKEMATIVGAVAEKSYIEKEGSKFGTPSGGVMCTGPYELTKWTAGNDIVLKANPHYWTPSWRPRVETVTIKWITDTSTLTSALLSGEIDGTYDAPVTSFPELMTSTSGKLYLGSSLLSTLLMVATNSGPMGNVNIRRALSLALDRSAIAKVVYDGAAIPDYALLPPHTTWTPTAKSVYESAYAKLEFQKTSLTEAKHLVRSVPDHGAPITLALIAGSQTQLTLATAVEQAGREIGLNIKFDELAALNYEDAEYTASYRKGIDLLVANTGMYNNTPLTYLDLWFPKGSVWDYTTYTSPAVNKDLNKALETYKALPRAELLTQAQAIYMKDYPAIPLVSKDSSLFLNKSVTGATASSAFEDEPDFAKLGASS